MAKIYPEQLRWFNEKELIDWLKGKRDCIPDNKRKYVVQYLINHLDEMRNAEHTIEIHVKIGDPTLEDATNLIEKKVNHTCINCHYYQPDVKYCEKLEGDNIEYNYGCGYWKKAEDG